MIGNTTATGTVDWEVGLPEFEVKSILRGATKRELDMLQVKIPIKRQSSFFVWRILVVLFLVYAMSWCSFGFDYTDFSDRANLNVTVTLALVALLFVISDNLPKLPYLTFIDKSMVISFVLVAITLIENYVVSRLDEGIAQVIDIVSIIAFPVVFLGSVLGMLIKIIWVDPSFSPHRHQKTQEQIFRARQRTPYYKQKEA